jgi:hypothetical protein
MFYVKRGNWLRSAASRFLESLVGSAALAALVIGQIVYLGGAVVLAAVVGLAAWWLSGRYFAGPS